MPETFQPRRGKENMQVILVEVSYTGLSNTQGRAQLKRKKYEDTLALLVEQGWVPVLITVILGTLGEITVDAGEALSENLGVRGPSLTNLLTALHKIALRYMNELIGMEKTLTDDIGGEHDQIRQSKQTLQTYKDNNKRGRAQITMLGTAKKKRKK